MNSAKRIILRADGNRNIGLGHVYRLIALADILSGEYQLTFAISCADSLFKKFLLEYVDELIELNLQFKYNLPSKEKCVEELPFDLEGKINDNDIVVVDGYWFGNNYQQAVKKNGAKLVVIDDLLYDHNYADAVINHAPGLTKSQFQLAGATKYYTGIDYCVIRKPFFSPFKEQKQLNELFIGFGGSDYLNMTPNATRQLLMDNSFDVIHVLTTEFFSEQTMKELSKLKIINPEKLKVHKNLDADSLVKVLDNCSFSVIPSSTLLIECYSRGLLCITGYYTDNQINIYRGFVRSDLAIGIGDFGKYDFTNLINDVAKASTLKKALKPLNSIQNIKDVFKSIC